MTCVEQNTNNVHKKPHRHILRAVIFAVALSFLQGTVWRYKNELCYMCCVCLFHIPRGMFVPRTGKIGWHHKYKKRWCFFL